MEHTITFEGVNTTVRSKEFSKEKNLKNDDNGEGLRISRWESEHRGMSKYKMFDKSRLKYFTF